MKSVLLASLLVFGASAASAVTFSAVPGAPDKGATHQTIIDNFEGASAPAGITYGGSYTIDNMSTNGFRAEPAGDTSNYFATPGSSDALPGTATIDFSGYIDANRPLRSLSFYWGSVDTYNTLEVLNRSGAVIATITGSDINNPANGDQSNPATNQRVFLRFSDSDNFGSLRLTSTQRAFEIDDIGASAVPEPATWSLLLTGVAFVGVALRRRQRTASVLN